VKYGLPELLKSENYIQGLMQVTGYTREGIEEMFTADSGPWLTPTREYERSEGYWSGYSPGDASSFSDNPGKVTEYYPHNIFVGKEFVEGLECALSNGDEEDINYAFFQLFFIISHESSHWAFMRIHPPNSIL
jgi:hypothetical protein